MKQRFLTCHPSHVENPIYFNFRDFTKRKGLINYLNLILSSTDRTQNRNCKILPFSFFTSLVLASSSDQPWLLQGPQVCLGENLRLPLLLRRQRRRGSFTEREFRRRIPICLSGSVTGSSPCFSLWLSVSSLLRCFSSSVLISTMALCRLPLLRHPPRALRFESVNLVKRFVRVCIDSFALESD